jgi:uncharacterized protein YxjI
MKYILTLTQTKAYGQIPVTGPNGKIQYIIKGNVDGPSHTLYLSDLNHQEVGRLYEESNALLKSYTVDVVGHSLVHVKRLNTDLLNLFYIERLNYLVTGSIKNGSYRFRTGFKCVATVETIIAKDGVELVCQISRPEDVPFILLISILFTQWHLHPLKLPKLSPFANSLQTKLD